MRERITRKLAKQESLEARTEHAVKEFGVERERDPFLGLTFCGQANVSRTCYTCCYLYTHTHTLAQLISWCRWKSYLLDISKRSCCGQPGTIMRIVIWPEFGSKSQLVSQIIQPTGRAESRKKQDDAICHCCGRGT